MAIQLICFGRPKAMRFGVFVAMSVLGLLAAMQHASAQGARVIPLPANCLVFDDVHQKIYAEIGAKGPGSTANSVTAINPMTGEVGTSVFVGDGLGSMTLSSDKKLLFITVSDGTSVREVNLATMTAGPLYPAPSGQRFQALLPLPGRGNGFLGLIGVSSAYSHELGVFIDGKLQGRTAGCGPCIALGIAPTRVFMYMSEISSWDFGAFDVIGPDVFNGPRSGDVISGYVGLSGSLNGLIITNNGSVVDPELRKVIGHVNVDGKAGALLPDPRTGYVYCIGDNGAHSRIRPPSQSSRRQGNSQSRSQSAPQPAADVPGQQISACDISRFQFVGTVPAPTGVSGNVGSPIRWGDDGFAYTVGDNIVLFHMPPGPLLPYVDLAIKRSEMPKVLDKAGLMSYQLTITNKGSQPSSAVNLSEQLPPDVDVVSVKASQGYANAAEGTVRGELGALAPGVSATVDITLHFGDVHDVSFTAVARGREPDPHPEDNIDRYTPPVSLSPYADLMGVWASLKQVSVGAGVDLHAGVGGNFIVQNIGNSTSQPCTVRFYLSLYPRLNVRESKLLQEVTIPAIRKGKSYVVEFGARLDVGDDVTGLFIFASIDPENEITESTKRNNVIGQRVP